MKIARIIGPEDLRPVPMHGHAGVGTQMVPFAESFNESMTTIAITPGDLQRELPDVDTTLQGHEERRSAGEGPRIGHLFSEVLEGLSAGSKKTLPIEGAGESRFGSASSREEVIPQDRMQDLVKRASAKVEASEAGLNGEEVSQANGVQPKGSSAAGEGPTSTEDAPSVDPGLKKTLKVDVAQRMLLQEKIHEPKEDHRPKGTIKTPHEGVQRKASKKEEAVGRIAIAPMAPQMPATTEANVSAATVLPVPVTSPHSITPKDPAVAGDGSLSPAIAAPKAAGETLGKTQGAQKKNASQVSSEPTKTDGGPKQSADPSLPETVKEETTSSSAPQKSEGTSVASPLPEKSHSLSPEISSNMVSTEVPIHGQGLPASLSEKASPVPATLADIQPGAAHSTSQQLYGADAHKTLEASTTTLEVGVPGGTHGWLKVRAEMAGDGVVHASVSSSSPAGTEMLRRELPSLTSYLHQEQLPVSSIVVHASSSMMDGSNLAGGGQGHDPSQGGTDPQGGTRQERGTAYPGEDAIHSGVSNEMDGLDSAGYTGGGGWLSIRA